MKPGKTLTELAAELTRQNETKKDYLLDTRNLIMDVEGDAIAIGDKDTVGVNEVAHSQIASHLNIPQRYYDRMRASNPALLAENVNAWFSNEPEVRMVRTLDGTMRAFLSERYRRIDNFDLAESVLPILGDYEVSFESTEVTEKRMYIKVVNKRLTKEVKPGDYVQSGLVITNSEVGLGTVTIQPLLYRLVCTNGMIVNDMSRNATRRRHIGKGNVAGEDYTLYASDTLLADDRALMLKIRDTIKATMDEVHFDNLIGLMKESAEAKIEAPDIPKMVELAGSTFGMTKAESEGVLHHLITGGDLTLYGLSNAVTRFAQDVESYDRSTELEKVGYDIMTMPGATWTMLNREVA